MRAIEHFDKGAALDPDALAFSWDGGQLTYREAQEQTVSIAKALVRLGLQPGERVCIYSPNSVTAFLCVLGVLRAGGVWVPLNIRNATQANITFLTLTKTAWLIFDESYSPSISELGQQIPSLTTLICMNGSPDGVLSLPEMVRAAGDFPLPPRPYVPNDLVLIISTGGTTGAPKAVMMTNQHFSSVVQMMQLEFPLLGRSVNLAAGPMTHGAGMLTLFLLAQGPHTLVRNGFDTETLLNDIEDHRVTFLFVPPTVLYEMLARPDIRDHDYSSLRYLAVTSAPCAPDKLGEAAGIFGESLCVCWGQAEAPVALTFLSGKEIVEAARGGPAARHLESCGRATRVARVAIMNEDGNLLPDGTPGEIVARSTLVTPGYYEDPEATAGIRTFGWHHTGDIGVRDSDGYFYIVDRKRDMIVSGGFNVYSVEVEAAVLAHPAVQDCAVVPRPHERWGEAVQAVVQLKPGATATEEEVRAFARERLGGVKAPKFVDFWEELPRSPNGKVLKRTVREHYWADSGRRVH